MKRRDFIKNAAALAALPGLGGILSAGNTDPRAWITALANAGETGRVLVLLQLKGGNDGLNTLIPLDQYAAYSNARKEVAIARSAVLPLDGYANCGFHPAMKALQKRFNEGKVRIVQAVGYPSQNFSHFRSTDIWMSASDSTEVINTGWAGRYLDSQYPGFPEAYPNASMPDPLAIEVGSVLSLAFQGGEMNMSMSVTDPANFYKLMNGIQDPPPETPAGKELAYIRTTSLQTNAYASVIMEAASTVAQQSSAYPAEGENALADKLKIVARLIAGGLKTKVYLVSLSGFDTHNDQVDETDSSQGLHASLLGKVSEAIDAFMTDLDFLNIANRVVGMTFSEFGRRIIANKSFGTDHGAAAPLFLFGNRVVPGILGENPTLPSVPVISSNIAMQYDFRAVYATVLNQWFKIDKNLVDAVLLKSFTTLPLFRDDETSVPELPAGATGTFRVFPNPVHDEARLEFESGAGTVLLELYDAKGALLQTLADREFDAGTHSIRFQVAGFTAGIYYVRLYHAGNRQTIAVLKQ